MLNKKEISKIIKEKINQNISKEQIKIELSSKYGSNEYEKILRDFPEPELKEKYKVLNWILIICIIIITIFKLETIIKIGLDVGVITLVILFLIGLIIPIGLIIYLLSYRASAYILTLGLTIYSLSRAFDAYKEIFSSGNIILISSFLFQLVIIFIIIILSFYLKKKIYPDYKLFSR